MLLICIPTTPGRRQRLLNCIQKVQESADADYGILTYENQLGGWTPALREMLKPLNKDQLVVVIGDDCEPQKGWMSLLITSFESTFPDRDGLCQPNDGAWNGGIASYPCATAGYLLKWTYSGYIHAHADEELACVARARNRYCYVPQAIVLHRHYQNTPGIEYDETYKLQENTHIADKLLFDQRVNQSGGYTDWQKLVFDEEVI
jgi:hypothetical protein